MLMEIEIACIANHEKDLVVIRTVQDTTWRGKPNPAPGAQSSFYQGLRLKGKKGRKALHEGL